MVWPAARPSRMLPSRSLPVSRMVIPSRCRFQSFRSEWPSATSTGCDLTSSHDEFALVWEESIRRGWMRTRPSPCRSWTKRRRACCRCRRSGIRTTTGFQCDASWAWRIRYARIAHQMHSVIAFQPNWTGSRSASERRVVGRGLVGGIRKAGALMQMARCCRQGAPAMGDARVLPGWGRRWDGGAHRMGTSRCGWSVRAPDWVRFERDIRSKMEPAVRVPHRRRGHASMPVAVDAPMSGTTRSRSALDVRVHEPATPVRHGSSFVRSMGSGPAELILGHCPIRANGRRIRMSRRNRARRMPRLRYRRSRSSSRSWRPERRHVGGFHDDAGPVATVEQLAGVYYSQSVTLDGPMPPAAPSSTGHAGGRARRMAFQAGHRPTKPAEIDDPPNEPPQKLRWMRPIVRTWTPPTARLGVTIADQPMVCQRRQRAGVVHRSSVCDATILIPAMNPLPRSGSSDPRIGRTDIQASAPVCTPAVRFAARSWRRRLQASGPSCRSFAGRSMPSTSSCVECGRPN